MGPQVLDRVTERIHVPRKNLVVVFEEAYRKPTQVARRYPKVREDSSGRISAKYSGTSEKMCPK